MDVRELSGMERRAVSGSPSFRRNPLVISGNVLASGDHTATFNAGNPDALLRSYLIFVRDMRGQRREPSIQLRNEDISVLAAHLGMAEASVLGGLLDLMGATRAQRSTMLALLAAGALTVVLSGSIVSSLSDDGVSVGLGRLADAVQAAVSGSDARTDASAATSSGTAEVAAPADTATAEAPAAASEGAGSAVAPRAVTAPAVTTPIAPAVPAVTASNVVISDSATITPSLDVLQSPAAAAASAAAASAAAGEPVSIGVTADGSLVASVAPPVPDTSDEPVVTAVLPDGSTVGVAAPPVPPSPDEGVATGELPDGTTVGVAAPPVPPAPSD